MTIKLYRNRKHWLLLTDQDDFYNKLDVSENNSDQFKHGSVNTKYEEANIQTKDGSGSTGANGAIILDHKLTKERIFLIQLLQRERLGMLTTKSMNV